MANGSVHDCELKKTKESSKLLAVPRKTGATPVSTSMVSPADLNEYMEGPVGEVELKFNESLRYRKADTQEEVIDMQHLSKPSESEFDLEEKRQIKQTIDEPVEHVNMLDDNEEGVNSFVESMLSKSDEDKDVRIKLSDKDS